MKDSIVIYKSWKPLIDSLPPDLRLQFYELLWGYDGLDYAPTIENPHLNGIFQFILSQVKQNDTKYEEKCKKAAESVRKRWNKNVDDSNRSDTNVYERINSNTDGYELIHNDNDNDNDNEVSKDTIKKEGVSFDHFWNAYGKKHDRPKCEKKWAKLSEKDKAAIMADIPTYRASVRDVQFLKYPLSYLNGENWKDERIETPTAPQPIASQSPRNYLNDQIKPKAYQYAEP